jgi:hypothetical protein
VICTFLFLLRVATAAILDDKQALQTLALRKRTIETTIEFLCVMLERMPCRELCHGSA